MRKTISKPILGILIVGFLIIVGVLCLKWRHSAAQKRKVVAALNDANIMRRYEALTRVYEADKPATKSALLSLAEDKDAKVRADAVFGLTALPLEQDQAVMNALVYHLEHDPDPTVRRNCLLGMINAKTSQTLNALIQASKDKDEAIACKALALLSLRGKEAIETLFQRLSAPSWRVRLFAARGLIDLKVADQRVVSTLEKMVQEPEASVYKAEIEQRNSKFDQFKQQNNLDFAGPAIWSLEDTLAQARQIAAQNK